MSPDGAALEAALTATWPAATSRRLGPWRLREGPGGGRRTEAATAEAAWEDADIAPAEAAMAAAGQAPLFRLRGGEGALDAALADRGYARIDPTTIHAAPLSGLGVTARDPLATFPVWPPLAVQAAIWTAGGIGPARQGVMHRAAPPRTTILARTGERAAGAAFVAVHGEIAFCHALVVAPSLRRRKSAVNILRAGAAWAQDAGASQLALAVREGNAPAERLCASLEMTRVGHYSYRGR